MISTKKRLLLLMLFCFVLIFLPALHADAKEIRVSSRQGNLRAAVASAADGDTIILDQEGQVNDDRSDSAPWVIDKRITIRGGKVNLRAGGIVLGADVTFDGVAFEFPNTERNVIAANGYTLTLNDTTYDTSANAVHLFCGTMYSSNGQVMSSVIPKYGSHGRIIINSTSAIKLGNIYAGSLSTDGTNQAAPIAATIEVNAARNSSIGLAYGSMEAGIYACGAMQTPGAGITFDTNYVQQPPIPHTGLSVTSPVVIRLTGGTVKKVDGATGGAANAELSFNGDLNLVSNVTLTNLSVLSVESGKFIPSSKCDLTNTDIRLSQGARLGFESIADPTIKSLTATDDGTIVLKRTQKLTITGAVSGEVKVSIDEYNTDTSSYAIEDHEYIEARNSTKNSFTLWPYPGGVNYVLVNHDGLWVAKIGPDPVLLRSISIADAEAYADAVGVSIPIAVSYVKSNDYLWSVPAKIKVNDVEMTREADDTGGYSYSSTNPAMEMFFDFDDTIEDCLRIYGPGENGELTAGEYRISIEIPWTNMNSGDEKTIDFTLRVVDKIVVPDLTFTDSDAYDIPSATVGTTIKSIDVAKEVSGGQPPYRFMAEGLPQGLSISEKGVIRGTLSAVSGEGEVRITVTDAANNSRTISITKGAIIAKDSSEEEQPQIKPPVTEPETSQNTMWREWQKNMLQYFAEQQKERRQIRKEHEQQRRRYMDQTLSIW